MREELGVSESAKHPTPNSSAHQSQLGLGDSDESESDKENNDLNGLNDSRSRNGRSFLNHSSKNMDMDLSLHDSPGMNEGLDCGNKSLGMSTDNIFEDTFPTMSDFDDLELENLSNNINTNGKVSLVEQRLLTEILNKSASLSISRHNDSSIITNGMNGNPGTEMPAQSDSPLVITGKVLKASTPVGIGENNPNAKSSNPPTSTNTPTQTSSHQHQVQRQLLAQEDEDFDFEKEFLQNKFETTNINKSGNGSINKSEEETNDILMDSVTSFMEVSLVISEDGEENINNIPNKSTTDPYKLSESILAAAAAMAQASDSDGSFTKEIFPGVITSESIFEESDCSSSSNDVLGSSPETRVDHPSLIRVRPLSQIPVSQARKIEEHDTFNSSIKSGETEPNSKSLYKPFLFQSKIIQVKVVQASEIIPDEFFRGNEPIGLGLLFVPPTRSNSMSKAGIGSKIVGKRITTPHSARTVGTSIQDEKQHSIALYTETSEIIWVLQWKIENSRNQYSLNNQFKVGDLFKKIKMSGKPIALLDSKEKLKQLLKSCGKYLEMGNMPTESQIWDPEIAEWLLNFEEGHSITLKSLLQNYFESESRELKRSGWSKEILEAFWASKLMTVLKGKLIKSQLWKHFTGE